MRHFLRQKLNRIKISTEFENILVELDNLMPYIFYNTLDYDVAYENDIMDNILY